jgi:SAM-dependent methyltransferase
MSTKQIQGKLWSTAPQYWANHFEPFFLPLYKKTLQQLSLTEDDSLLDAGCGSGMFSRMAISTGAHVIGIDAAPGLLHVARERNPGHNFLEEDLEAMPFANESFNYVAGFNSFQYAGNFANALQEAKRVLKPNGKLVIGVWDRQENNEAAAVLRAIGSLLPPPPPGTPGPFALSEEGMMEKILESIGLNSIAKTQVSCPFLYHSLGDGVKSFMGTGPAAAALNYASKKLVEQTVADALQPFHITEDFYHLQNSFLLFTSKK